jgi:hypothetical protein
MTDNRIEDMAGLIPWQALQIGDRQGISQTVGSAAVEDEFQKH